MNNLFSKYVDALRETLGLCGMYTRPYCISQLRAKSLGLGLKAIITKDRLCLNSHDNSIIKLFVAFLSPGQISRVELRAAPVKQVFEFWTGEVIRNRAKKRISFFTLLLKVFR